MGQAAIQLAQRLGLVVYVTLGTGEKRKFIKEQYGIPVENMFNSRDTSFAKGIQRVTSGRGVDCVLNSLSGMSSTNSAAIQAPFGMSVGYFAVNLCFVASKPSC